VATVPRPPQVAPAPTKTTPVAPLETPPPPRALAIDWNKVSVQTEDDALALWREIAPTGDDWEAKVAEIPEEHPAARLLAIALLHGGNFSCTPAPSTSCHRAVTDSIPPPRADATFDDPCLRRELALWSIDELDQADLPAVHDALRAIASLPPPESQLVSAAIDAYPMSDPDRRLELLGLARAAGHDDLVNATGNIGDFDDAHLVAALVKYHIDGVIDVLPAAAYRAEFLTAINDDKLLAQTRINAINEVTAELAAGALPRDVRTALVTATKAADCRVAAAAARVLVAHGERKFAPARPHTRSAERVMRGLCVLASYEAHLGIGEPTYLLGYVRGNGITLTSVEYDRYSDVDADGDGDPHTVRTIATVPRDELVLPEIDELIEAFAHCEGQVCRSDNYEFQFELAPDRRGEVTLTGLEIAERPPCR
jgi:hypothetical protein